MTISDHPSHDKFDAFIAEQQELAKHLTKDDLECFQDIERDSGHSAAGLADEIVRESQDMGLY